MKARPANSIAGARGRATHVKNADTGAQASATQSPTLYNATFG